jgi:hypothetical protein
MIPPQTGIEKARADSEKNRQQITAGRQLPCPIEICGHSLAM